MSEAEQKKRRFVIYLTAQIVTGVVCDDYILNMAGLVFYGSKLEGSWMRFTVLGIAPGHYLSFYELADSDSWPESVKVILDEEGRRKK